MLLPGNNRELFLISNGNESESMFGMPKTRMQNIIVISKSKGNHVEEHIVCIDNNKGHVINLFDMTKGKWTFLQSTNSLDLERCILYTYTAIPII